MARVPKVARMRRGARARLWGAPEPENFKRGRVGQALQKAARIHLRKSRDIDRLLAVEKLAIDIFSNSASARAFAVNPTEYMTRAGFPDVKLDLNSLEVRLAMAMGDPKVRQSAAEGDAIGFVRAVMDQGLRDLSVLRLGGLFFVEVVAVSSAIAVNTAVAVNTAAAVNTAVAVTEVEVTVGGSTPIAIGGATAVARQVDMLSRMATDLGSPALARSIRSAKVKKVLEEYNRLQLANRRRQSKR